AAELDLRAVRRLRAVLDDLDRVRLAGTGRRAVGVGEGQPDRRHRVRVQLQPDDPRLGRGHDLHLGTAVADRPDADALRAALQPRAVQLAEVDGERAADVLEV